MEVGLGFWPWAQQEHHFEHRRKGGKTCYYGHVRGREDEIGERWHQQAAFCP